MQEFDLQVHILNAVTHYKLNRFSHLLPAVPGIDVRTPPHHTSTESRLACSSCLRSSEP